MDATNFIMMCESEVGAKRDGVITSEELGLYMGKLGFSAEAVSHVFEQLDIDSDGGLSRDEVADVFLKYSALRLALRKP